MKLSLSLRRYATRLNLPAALLVTLLQRNPVASLIQVADDYVVGSPVGAVLKGAAAAIASLGAMQSLAGATAYVLSATVASPLSTTVGTNTTGVAFTVTNTINIGSWMITGTIPPGMQISAIEGGNTVTGGGGVLDATTPGTMDSYGDPVAGNAQTTPVLSGTPTAAGTYTITMQAYEYGGLTGLVAPAQNFVVNVAGNAPTTVAPAITSQPVGATVTSGTTVVFNVAATGTPTPSYQWNLNSNPISGATSARLVINGATAANAGAYTVKVSNTMGSVTSGAGTLAFVTTGNPGRLGNISVLSSFAAGQILTVGFVTGGAGTSGTQSLLIRADGPALAGFGLTGTMADPQFQVIPLGGSTSVASNNNWGTPASNAAPVIAADAATGAFPLTTGSLDAAEVVSLTSGGYSVQVSGTGAGTALTELYDTTPIAAYTLTVPRLVNVSCNTTLPVGGTLTAGFTVGGVSNKTVLIRASGPTLAGFGLTGTTADPQIVVQASGSSSTLASNAGWGGDPQIAAAAASVGAFAFASPTSKDSAVLLTLAPGGYSAVVNSASGGGGTTVVEVYEIP